MLLEFDWAATGILWVPLRINACILRGCSNMGGCCSTLPAYNDPSMGVLNEVEDDVGDDIQNGDGGARVRLQGASTFISMFTQQGRKGINQDAMTVWEEFTGKEDTFFCGVFDGHGPSGHTVGRHIRDVLPSKLYSEFKASQLERHTICDVNTNLEDISQDGKENNESSFFCSWKASFIKSFEEVDDNLRLDSTIDSYCSGTTAVAMLKHGSHLIIANLGDSRAVLCTREGRSQLVPIQLTVDMKPNLPCEEERIKKCQGRVFAVDEEPGVYRIWMPEENWPGLAMSRAFGDFCLKDFGLTCTPEVSYRRLTDKDEFVVLATDGVWDVLTNTEVIRFVASTKNRRMAAKVLVARAIGGWRRKYPTSKIDDCAVIILFLKHPPLLFTKSKSALTTKGNERHQELSVSRSFKTSRSQKGPESLTSRATKDSEWSALEGVTRVNSIVKVPRFGVALSC